MRRSGIGELWSGSFEAARRFRLSWARVEEYCRGLPKRETCISDGRNSGHQALGLAYLFGARRIILLGYDFQRTGGRAHWHADHPPQIGNLAADLDGWQASMSQLARDIAKQGVEVVNCTRETALTCFSRAELAAALRPNREPLLVQGMHGLGDNLHQRAIIRQLMEEHEVYLETSWPCVYHDLIAAGLKLVAKDSRLRTQKKNAKREHGAFAEPPSKPARTTRIWYPPDLVRQHGSVLGAMCAATGTEVADFSLPVPPAWQDRAQRWLDRWRPQKPLLIYRPLIERTEWSGCATRNPDHRAYASLLRAIRERFFVVSVADLVPKVEWAVGEDIKPDVALHQGELDIETLAALVQRAALVYCSPGFAAPLAQAVGTPVVCVFGGYENSKSFSAGARFSRYLGIDTRHPCQCFSHVHACDKRIDLEPATRRLLEFIGPANREVIRCSEQAAAMSKAAPPRPSVRVAGPPLDMPGFDKRYFNPGELERLITLVRGVSPRVMVEFGCNEGRAARAILRNVPTITQYVGIDVLPGYVARMPCQRNETPKRPGHLVAGDRRFRLILPPRGSFDLSPSDLPAADAVFIDADHSREGVLQDWSLARAILRPGGICVFHDDNRRAVVQVSETLDEIHAGGQEICHVEGTWLAYAKIGADHVA